MSGALPARWLLCGMGCAVAIAVTAWVQQRGDAVAAAAPPVDAADAPRFVAPQPWQPPIVVLPAAAPTPAPAAPPMPFSYVGGWSEAGRPAAVLRRDGQVFTVRASGPLDSQYAVEAIEAERVLLRHRPSGAASWLALGSAVQQAVPAEPSAAAMPVGAQVAPVDPTVDVDSERQGN